jgi:hypothetical protein
MLANYPTSIVVHGIALNITVQSYDTSLDFGMMACGKAMPDVAGFARCLLESFEELKALPATAAARAVSHPGDGSSGARRRSAPASPLRVSPRRHGRRGPMRREVPARR